jgi:hypothetical protein
MIDFVIKFFAVIGIIILVVYLINYIVSLYKQRAENSANKRINPPPAYMQNSGIKCPDYFSNIGVDKESYNCSNRDFNINVNSPDTCYNNVNDKTMRFPIIPSGKTWEFGNPNGLTSLTNQEKWDLVRAKVGTDSLSRCDWIQQCGSSQGVNGVWQGVSRWCNMSDPSQASM